MTEDKIIKYSGKDTVFRDMFSNPKYLLQLYRVLHPEDESITEADLEIVTLQSILLNGIYNDLGFLVRKDRLMVLVEAQSTWSPNIVIRSLMYLMNTCQEYFTKQKIQLYGSSRAQMPKPELYVIYTGEKGNHPDVLSLKKEFFPDTDCCIDAKVKVIYLRNSNDIINQYIGFCRVFNEQVALYGRTLKAVKEIVRICRDMDILSDYLGERETEVEGIMLALFDQEQVWNIEKEHIRQQALEQGVSQGLSQGLSQGRLAMLIDLVRDGSLSLTSAAKKANLDEEKFKARMTAAL